MYNYNVVEGGISYTVYFFATFIGHFQPYTPKDPLEFNEIYQPLIKYDSCPYYQAWYSESPSGPRLDKLIKYWLMREPFTGSFEQTKIPGVYFRRLEKKNGEWPANEVITPEVVLQQSHYLRYVITNEGHLESAYRIYSMVLDSYEYIYNKNGTLEDTNIIRNLVPEKIPDP